MPTEVRHAESTHRATLIDISEGGAAIYTDEAFYTNEKFVELHTEGYETLCGRVAREFSGGFALECGGEVERQRAREELEIFKETLGKRQEFKTLAALHSSFCQYRHHLIGDGEG